MHPEMTIRLAQLHVDEMTRRAEQRRPRRTRRARRPWRRHDAAHDGRPTATAPAPLVHLRPPRAAEPGGAVGGDDRRAA